jgi:histidinol-phosphatase (PHP family)
MRAKYRGKIEILIGFEGEYIDPSYGPFVEAFARDPRVDFFIGSVHHVNTVPIDFDRAMYEQSRDVTDEKSDKGLFEKYFDEQFEMLKTLKPRVVAHFDLIRLFSDEPDRDWKAVPGVWNKIVRNLGFMKEQDMLLEVNSSALRKGLKEPYPGKSICKVSLTLLNTQHGADHYQEYLRIGGKFTLSDDSHGVAQVGLNFERVQGYLESIGVETLYYFLIEPGWLVASNVLLSLATVALKDLDLRAYPSTL